MMSPVYVGFSTLEDLLRDQSFSEFYLSPSIVTKGGSPIEFIYYSIVAAAQTMDGRKVLYWRLPLGSAFHDDKVATEALDRIVDSAHAALMIGVRRLGEGRPFRRALIAFPDGYSFISGTTELMFFDKEVKAYRPKSKEESAAA